MNYKIKVDPTLFDAINAGSKHKFHIIDKDIKLLDRVTLQKFDPDEETCTGDEMLIEVSQVEYTENGIRIIDFFRVNS